MKKETKEDKELKKEIFGKIVCPVCQRYVPTPKNFQPIITQAEIEEFKPILKEVVMLNNAIVENIHHAKVMKGNVARRIELVKIVVEDLFAKLLLSPVDKVGILHLIEGKITVNTIMTEYALTHRKKKTSSDPDPELKPKEPNPLAV